MELSFEYLLSKDRLQWVTVDSPQVIFLSLCLQSMVEELMRKQHGSSSITCSHQVNIFFLVILDFFPHLFQLIDFTLVEINLIDVKISFRSMV